MDNKRLINRVFRVNYINKILGAYNRRILVFTKALSFAKEKCDNGKVTIDEILIYFDDSEEIGTQWLVTAETHSIISA